jgi:signal transduction histidine kinase
MTEAGTTGVEQVPERLDENTEVSVNQETAVDSRPPWKEALEVRGAVLLVQPEGEILYMTEAAREALESLGVGAPGHVRDLPLQLREALASTREEMQEAPPGLVELTKGLWGVRLPMKEVDPEWLRGMAEAEQMAAVGELAATVAQEIGGPNTSIQVMVDHLLESPLGRGEAERAALKRVLTQTERITRLTRQLIALADPGRPHLIPLDVNEIVESACELMEGSFAAWQIDLQADLRAGFTRAMGDRNHLLQVLINLLLNARGALQAWTGQRLVRVRTQENGDRVYLHVEDSGPGIPPEDATRIFLPFVSTTGGTGMGLFLTRQVLVEQGGGIRVHPKGELGGATFTVYLEKATDD